MMSDVDWYILATGTIRTLIWIMGACIAHNAARYPRTPRRTIRARRLIVAAFLVMATSSQAAAMLVSHAWNHAALPIAFTALSSIGAALFCAAIMLAPSLPPPPSETT